MNIPTHVSDFNPSEILVGLKSFIISFVAGIGLADFLLFSICTMTIGVINLAGWYENYLFEVKRKRVYYLDKINDSGDYEGYI